jgi:hypothetical protein
MFPPRPHDITPSATIITFITSTPHTQSPNQSNNKNYLIKCLLHQQKENDPSWTPASKPSMPTGVVSIRVNKNKQNDKQYRVFLTFDTTIHATQGLDYLNNLGMKAEYARQRFITGHVSNIPFDMPTDAVLSCMRVHVPSISITRIQQQY